MTVAEKAIEVSGDRSRRWTAPDVMKVVFDCGYVSEDNVSDDSDRS
jgi:hypothetical protein